MGAWDNPDVSTDEIADALDDLATDTNDAVMDALDAMQEVINIALESPVHNEYTAAGLRPMLEELTEIKREFYSVAINIVLAAKNALKE